MRKVSIIIFLIFAGFLSEQAYAQVPVTKSTEIQIIDGKTFYIHEVQKGQTLYSISKVYQCTVDEIKSTNHIKDNSLQAGYLLKIPTQDNKISETDILNTNAGNIESAEYIIQRGESLTVIAQKHNTTVENIRKMNPGIGDNISIGQTIRVPVISKPIPVDSALYHTVSKGETLFGIAKKYLLRLSEIKAMNPGLTETLSIGQQIIVGYKSDEVGLIKTDSTCNCENPKKLNEYNVALLIPLYLDRGSFKDFNKDRHDENEWYHNVSFSFIQFYEGLKFALDTLKSSGMNVNLHVFDLDDSDAKLNKVLNDPAMRNMHLIIGPFLGKHIDTISKFSYENKIPMVNCYLSGQTELQEINPYFFNPITSVEFQMKGLADFFKAERSESNVIIAYQQGGFEEKAALMLDSFLKANSYPSWKLVNITESGLKGATGQFVGGKRENILVMLASGELYVENIIRSLNEYKDKYSISLYGLPSWLNYEVLDLEFLEFQNTHFFSSSFTDFENEDVRDYAERFQKRYKADPERLAYAGYDLGLYFLSALNNYGPDFYKCIDKHKAPMLATELNFSFSPADGFRNTYISIYKMKDFQLWKVK
ncbi:MAG: hypothetical protein A2W93_14655 [Bacteroidetes bacterium GWF2_43_63]|nr:MAG: hypothetical protein A2W94_01225 [Bacteroidetes bacterium GWE2_42_42]OFY52581.1 MAG: hypothetical protein A2W93_14655 [Bacteroidetes bacterium GWF2_43_63]HBG71489.1 hypothetical protein [Bacteroidales bacterium]HCB60759.1 hypothetical protein [Bacteroidales bacterium]HCY23516.1 hypothetical protein [Bacteroidales bacterium]